MEVEVVIAFKREHDKVILAYMNGLTVEKALDQSGLLDKYNLSKQDLNVGIFSPH
jgi:putative ubiquitin-RnfH superfamily antitoxin RatB of RatAB toxin-antitoxin module